jgi:hypothetical protein
MQKATPARKRPVKTVIFCGKLAFRVRVGDMEDPDWEVTDVFDASLTARRAVRVHLRKREPGSSFLPSHKPEWDPDYAGAGTWRESAVRVWWDRLMKVDAPIDLTSLPDRDDLRAREMQQTWESANEQFRREVLDMKPIDLTALTVETARERERAQVEADLIRSGVPKGCAEWEEAMAAADKRAEEFGDKEIAEARAWRDQALARDAQVTAVSYGCRRPRTCGAMEEQRERGGTLNVLQPLLLVEQGGQGDGTLWCLERSVLFALTVSLLRAHTQNSAQMHARALSLSGRKLLVTT